MAGHQTEADVYVKSGLLLFIVFVGVSLACVVGVVWFFAR